MVNKRKKVAALLAVGALSLLSVARRTKKNIENRPLPTKGKSSDNKKEQKQGSEATAELDVGTAISLVLEKYPDKKINGNPGEYKGEYAFSMVSKHYVEGTPNWDSTIVAINKKTGAIRIFGAFEEPDFLFEAKPLTQNGNETMISAKSANDAYDIVKKHNPGMEACSCYEYVDFYAFGLIPQDLAENDGFANSTAYLVDKNTGKYSTAYFLDVPNDYIREIDTRTFL